MPFLILGGLGILGLTLFGFRTEIVETVETKLDSWRRFDQFFKLYSPGKIGGVDGWKILKAIALNESDLGKYPSVALGIKTPHDVEGSKSQDAKSWGIMQMTIPTARDLDPRATEVMLNNPEYSIKLSGQYVKWLTRYFSPLDTRFLEYVVKSYNQGPRNTQKEIAGKTQGYANEYWSRFVRNLKRVEENP